jgi:hypothetical protein
MGPRKEFIDAIRARDATAIGEQVDYCRLHGCTYNVIFDMARSVDPTLDQATWDALLAESEE